MSLLHEFKRRKVFRVAVVYAATTFVVLQAADIMLPRLAVPEWAMSLIVVLAVLGFPIALVLAWALELTPDGVKVQRTGTADAAPEETPPLLGKRTLIVAGLLVVLGIGLSAGWLLKPGGPSLPPATSNAENAAQAEPIGRSIAVLPFENFSKDPGNEYFGDALADTLLHKLAQIKDLKVIARNSSFQFRDGNQDVREIGTILGVETLLEGSVQRAGNQVRIIAQLVRTSDGAHVWSRTFESTMDDIFELQDRVSDSIVDAFAFSLSEAERERLRRDGTDDPVAYDLLMRARNLEYTMDERTQANPEDFEKLQLLRQAIERDPAYAEAWVELASAWSSLAFAADSARDFDRFVAESEAAAREALRLAPSLPGPHNRMGWVAHRKGDRLEAARHFRRALEIDPNDLGAISGLALQIGWDDPAMMLALLDRAIELDPTWAFGQRQRHFAFNLLGKVDEAVEALNHAIELSPDEGVFYSDLHRLMVGRGRPDEGARILSKLLRRSPASPIGRTNMAFAWTAATDFERAGQWVELTLRNRAESDQGKLQEVQRLLAAGQYSAAIDHLADIPENNETFGMLRRLGSAACLALDRSQCARKEFDGYRQWLTGEAIRGSSYIGLAVFADLLEVLVEEAEGGTLEASVAAEQWQAILDGLETALAHEPGVIYARAGVLVRMGQTQQALALLDGSTGVEGGPVHNIDLYGLSVNNSLLLDPLRATPGFQAWLTRYEAQREAMLARMRTMERRGEIVQPATVERMGGQ